MIDKFYIPLLIVGKDSNANYVKLKDAIPDMVYYCPCCGNKIKLRANNSELVQPHFYHCDGNGCDNETISHWLYKNWLFEKGSKFVLNYFNENKTYLVEDIEIEKIHKTEFGNYKPDITVKTTDGRTVYFEINYSNKKDINDYYFKWQYLKNDVVEVDIRSLMNCDYNSEIPNFNVLYSDEKIFNKSCLKFENKDYCHVVDYQSTIMRQLNSENKSIEFRKRLRQVDEFWVLVHKYRLKKISLKEILDIYEDLSLDDMEFCYYFAKRLKCVDLAAQLKEINNNKVIRLISEINVEPYKRVDINQESPRITYVGFLIDNIEDSVNLYYGLCLRGNYTFLTIDILERISNFKADEKYSEYYNSFKEKFSDNKQHLECLFKEDPKDNVQVNIYSGVKEREYVSMKGKLNGKTYYKYVYENKYHSIWDYGMFSYLRMAYRHRI